MTSEEIKEIMGILELLGCLDPEGKYFREAFANINTGFNYGVAKERMAKIISFP